MNPPLWKIRKENLTGDHVLVGDQSSTAGVVQVGARILVQGGVPRPLASAGRLTVRYEGFRLHCRHSARNVSLLLICNIQEALVNCDDRCRLGPAARPLSVPGGLKFGPATLAPGSSIGLRLSWLLISPEGDCWGLLGLEFGKLGLFGFGFLVTGLLKL